MPKGKKEHNWREWLEGKYRPENQNVEDQYRFTIRKRAKRMIRDLKLILEKARPSDLYMIFSKDEKEWKEIMFPVASHLLTLIGQHLLAEKEMKRAGWLPVDIKLLTSRLKQNGIKYALWKLVEDEEYRKKKEAQLKNENRACKRRLGN